MPRFGVAHGIYAFALLVAVLAAFGASMAAGVFSSPPAGGTSGGTARVGEPLRTSFGSITVERSTRGEGLGARDLAGMTHGIQNFVPEDHVLQQVQLVIANGGDEAVHYSPDQFTVVLRNKGKQRIRVLSSNVKAGSLQPRASIELNLGFIVPRNGAGVSLAFADPVTRKQLLVDLGQVDRAPPGASHNH